MGNTEKRTFQISVFAKDLENIKVRKNTIKAAMERKVGRQLTAQEFFERLLEIGAKSLNIK